MLKKFSKLQSYIKNLGKVVVAFSGGVDSTFLLKASSILDTKSLIAVTFTSELYSKSEILSSVLLAKKFSIKHELIKVDHLALLKNNPTERCYLCKKYLFNELLLYSQKNGYNYVIDGSNYDDMFLDRPGRKASKELGVISPLEILEYTKKEIRETSKLLGLETFNKQARPCYLTRFPYNTLVRKDMITDIDKIECSILNLGFNFLRVRFIKKGILQLVLEESEIDKVLVNRKKILEIGKNSNYEIVLSLMPYALV